MAEGVNIPDSAPIWIVVTSALGKPISLQWPDPCFDPDPLHPALWISFKCDDCQTSLHGVYYTPLTFNLGSFATLHLNTSFNVVSDRIFSHSRALGRRIISADFLLAAVRITRCVALASSVSGNPIRVFAERWLQLSCWSLFAALPTTQHKIPYTLLTSSNNVHTHTAIEPNCIHVR